MSNIDILHIYTGTAGISGTYLHSIYKNLNFKYKQECITNYYYPFEEGKKIFFKNSELTGGKYYKNRRTRLIYRYYELTSGFIYVIVYILKNNVKKVNYSLIMSLKIQIYFLLVLRKFLRTKIIITCHDIIPFETTYSNRNKSFIVFSKIYHLADFLIVHNKSSFINLKNFYNINVDKIFFHHFPIMDSSLIFPLVPKSNNKIKFLFIGHLRKEKGLNILIEAWELLFHEDLNISLTIAGNKPPNVEYEFEKLKTKNCTIYNDYVDDKTYHRLLCESNYVILPYLSGTNTGIISSAISVNTVPITSDLPMFLNNSLVFPLRYL